MNASKLTSHSEWRQKLIDRTILLLMVAVTMAGVVPSIIASLSTLFSAS